VATIPIVRLADDVEKTIASKMDKAVSLREEANELENALSERAERVIDEFLHGT
jgi:hypothetical protein